MTLYLGIDAGGTSCKARLTDENGLVLASGTAGPANTRMGLEAVHQVLLEACRQATDAAGLTDAELRSVKAGMGIAGINRAGMKPRLQALEFPFASVTLSSDSVIANLGAHRGGDGAILILGTGSVGLIKRGEDSTSIGG
jgi:glucosamine kinase